MRQGEPACKPASVPPGALGVAAIHLGPALPPASWSTRGLGRASHRYRGSLGRFSPV
jgi:hypothetical protein